VKHLSCGPFYGKLLALPTNIGLGWKRNVGDKHSSLLRKFVNYGQKTFYNIGPCTLITCKAPLQIVWWPQEVLRISALLS